MTVPQCAAPGFLLNLFLKIRPNADGFVYPFVFCRCGHKVKLFWVVVSTYRTGQVVANDQSQETTRAHNRRVAGVLSRLYHQLLHALL